MASNHLPDILRQIRDLVDASDRTDEELLGRFVTGRDPAAFEALVRRHAPLVLGVCRRRLSRPQDVEDAFQATFVVLLRKAGSVRGRLPCWLYGVANRVALRARARSGPAPPGPTPRCPRPPPPPPKPPATSPARSCAPCSTRRSPACPRSTGRRCCCATCRTRPRSRPPASSAGPRGPSPPASP